MTDDSDEFERNRIIQSQRLGNDRALFDLSLDGICAADKYNYAYLWSWFGLPIIQLPADIMATQEVIFATRPDIIIETGVARGGSIIFLASLLELIGKGRVIGVDISIREHNRRRIESHPMSRRISLVEGSSSSDATLAEVRSMIPKDATTMVILDSDHSRDHVLSELRGYGPLVTKGQYLVVADTVLGHLRPDQTPTDRSGVWKAGNEPSAALKQYLEEARRFEVDPVINGKLIFSSSPGGYLRCIAD